MTLLTHRAGAIALAAVLASAAAGPATAVEPAAPNRLLEFDETIGIALRRMLGTAPRRLSKRDKAERDSLSTFYAERSNLPVFVSRLGLNARALSTMSEIRKAGEWALPADEFALPKLADASKNSLALPHDVLAKAELKLSLAVLKYARYAKGGRSEPSAITPSFDRRPPLPEPGDVMEEIASAPKPGAVLRSFQPTHPQFRHLLREYLAMLSGSKAAAPDVPKLPPGPSLKIGTKDARVPILRRRLALSKPVNLDPNLFGDDLDKAVRTYQEKAGLDVDGVVGPGTRASLNGDTVKATPEKLLVNLEQWRWMPDDLGDMHIWVNIPEFKVRVIRNGKIVHTERVVVGKRTNQTPVFSENLKWVEFHPSWYVPTSIKVNEIAPGFRRRGYRFLDKQNLKVNCPEGAYVKPKPKVGLFGITQPQPRPRIDLRNCQVVQPPGPKNVLGIVKFKLPNKHNVYLHDTSSKSLFNRTVRAFSHGCIRVRNPLKLAQIVLGHDQGTSKARIQTIADGPRKTVQTYLKKQMPVHITYFTAIADETGKLRYHNDIYDHEKRIALGIRGKYSEIAPVPKPSRPVPRPRAPTPAPSSKPQKDWLKTIFGGF